MATFYASYPATNVGVIGIATVQGEGTAGTPTGGVLTVQGDPSGTPIPITGSITATNPSVGATGAAVPASGTYVAASVAGTLTGLVATAAGLKVDGSAATQPVSGTVAATQSGTWTVQPGNTANTTAWKVDGSAVTQPVSGTVAVSNFPATQPVSGTVAATQSGTWNIGTVTTVTGVTTVAAVTAITNALPAGSNVIGHVIVDSGTLTAVTAITNALPAGSNVIGHVIVDSVPAVTTSAATFQAEGSIAFGSLTNAYQTIFTPSAATKILQMRNNTNAAVSVSFDAGTTLNYVLDAGDQVSLDLLSNAMVMTTTAIQAKYTVGAPTSGSFRVNGCH